MYTQHPPFCKAEPSDPFYRYLCANRDDMFWKTHAKNKPEGMAFFSEEFKSLVTAMLQYDPTHRLTLAEVKTHPWVTGPVATLEEIQHEFAARKAKIDHDAEVRRQQKQAEKEQRVGGGTGKTRRVYRSMAMGEPSDENEGDAEDHEEEEESKFEVVLD